MIENFYSPNLYGHDFFKRVWFANYREVCDMQIELSICKMDTLLWDLCH